MRIICVTLWGQYEAQHAALGVGLRSGEKTRAHFAERGVDAQFFYGIHAPKLGIDTTLPYEVDGGPGCGFKMGPKPTGCWLSHRAVWAACLLLPDDVFFIVEDDAKFPGTWKERVDGAVAAAPTDWNMIFVGSCCTKGKVKGHVAGELYDVRWPLCTHGYLVRRKTLESLIATQDAARCYAPIDISLGFHTLGQIGGVYTVLPRILDQHDTDIPE